jgi:hypothetical protein
LVCRLEERVIFNTGLTMEIFRGVKLMRWDLEIIKGVVGRIQYNYWISLCIHMKNITFREDRSLFLKNRIDTIFVLSNQ